LALLLARGAPLEAGALLDTTAHLPQQGVFQALAEPASTPAAQTLVDVVDEADGYRLRVLLAGLRGRPSRDADSGDEQTARTRGLTFVQHPLVRARLRALLAEYAYLQQLMGDDRGPDVPRFRDASLAEGIVVALIVGAPAVDDLVALASVPETAVALVVARHLPSHAKWISAIIPVLLARNEPEVHLAVLKQLYGPHVAMSFWGESDDDMPLARSVTTLLDDPDPAVWHTTVDVLAGQLADLAGIEDTAASSAVKEAAALAMLSHERVEVRTAAASALFSGSATYRPWPSPPVVRVLAALGRSSSPSARATAKAGLLSLAHAALGPHSAACRDTLHALIVESDDEIARAARTALYRR
jgi:hypothetical protein